MTTDLKEERFVCHTLQLALQAALDVASHVVSDQRLGEPSNLRDFFGAARPRGWIEAEQVPSL